MSFPTSHAYVIEVHSRTAGIVVRQGRRFYFHAAAEPFVGLEGLPFRSPQHAQQAALARLKNHGGRRAA